MNGLIFGVMILGAGASVRMGKPKLGLPWRGQTILGHLVDEWGAVGASQIAVVRSELDQVVQEILREKGVPTEDGPVNAKPSRGMFSSIHVAASWKGWTTELTHIVLSLGDQPQIHRETLKRLIEFARENPTVICQPARFGRPKHPIVFPWSIWKELAQHNGPSLREFLLPKRPAIKLLEVDDTGIDLDLDTPEDYRKALENGGN